VKRTFLRTRRFLVSTFLSALALALTVPVTAWADDTKPAVAPPRPDAKGIETKKDPAAPKKNGEELKKEDPEVLLAELFGKEENITNTLGMVMVWIPDGYRVAQYEVMQAQYLQIMDDNPSKFPAPQYPVDSATYNEAIAFCKKLTERELTEKKLPKGYSYALPTEQQWEVFVDEAELKQAVTSYFADRKNPENVGLFRPNKFGLYDTRGNVWDWCGGAVGRGASWRSYEDYVFVQFRYVGSSDQRYDDIGFRVILQGKAAGAPAPQKTGSQLALEEPKPQATKSY
jgi:sulfatase-modifying factor enzyme 1